MVRMGSAALLAGVVIVSSSLASAQEAGSEVVAVAGLAGGDLLNIREKATAFGKVVGRLPNGSLLTKISCEQIKDHRWCRVASQETPTLIGYAPERYLLSTGGGGAAADAGTEPMQETVGISGGYSILPSNATEPELMAVVNVLPYPADRSGQQAAVGGTEASVEAILDAAEQEQAPSDARLSPEALAQWASANGETPASAEEKMAATDTAPETAAADAPGSTGKGDRTAGERVAGIGSAETRGLVPCAQQVGQPASICSARVRRLGPGSAEVVVEWPNGGTRSISFKDGKPAESAGAPVRFTREGTLNFIKVGTAERFEILDALAFGSGTASAQ
ncbi:MAG: hypothetical protein DI629_07240 [Mesorhizobium amorphae]|nr:MAG: hypothetical protein DI629_07240 [Mesorhizobium amorphae]